MSETQHYFPLGQIPVNTLVALGTKTKTARHRSLANGCVSSKTDVVIENGRAIRIMLHRPSRGGEGGPLRDGDGVNILNVCGGSSEAHSLEAAGDDSLVWRPTGTLQPAAFWYVFESPHGVATTRRELEIMQSVYLVHADKIVSTLPNALKFSLSTTYLHGTAFTPVPFYFTTPHYLPTQRIPKFITEWFPTYRLNNERWLTAWNQSTALHLHHKSKWNKEVLAQLAVEANAAGLLTASEASSGLATKPWTRDTIMAKAELHMGVQPKVLEWKKLGT